MANILKPKRRTADGTAPTTGNLQDGEFAINTVSRAIYQRVGSNVIMVANYFSGAWADVTNKPASFPPSAHTHAASNITSGVMAVARLGSGSPSTATFLRGDGTWAAVPATTSAGHLIRKQQVFTASGTFTPSAAMIAAGGQCEVLVVGGGGGGISGYGGGSGGAVILRVFSGITTPQSVVVGAGGSGGTSVTASVGSASSFGTLVTAPGGVRGSGNSNFTDPSTAGEGSGAGAGGSAGTPSRAPGAGAYGFGAGGAGGPGAANTGQGGGSHPVGNGGSGIVIVTYWEVAP